MGKLEETSRKRSRKNVLKRLILETIKISGIISIGLIALPVVGAMAKMGMIPSRRQQEVIKRSCTRLVHAGLLQYTEKGMRLSKKGEETLRRLKLRDYQLRKPKRWDKKWRVISFDVPVYRKGLRDKIRRTLQAIGFKQLHQSVWIYPYDCEDLITLLKADFKIGKDVLYMIVDTLENDDFLRKDFRLSV